MKKVIPILLLLAATARADVTDDLREGDKYFEDGEYDRAAAAYDRAIAENPGQVTAEAYGKRASIFLTKDVNDPEGGLTFVREVAEKQHKDAPEILQYEAAILWKLGKKGDAITVAEKAAKAMPSSFVSQALIGQFYTSRDPKKTAVAYEAYLQYRPADQSAGDVTPRIQLGLAYLTLANAAFTDDNDDKTARDDYAKAVIQFDTLKRSFGKNGTATANADNGLCAAYTGMGKFDQAITICEQIVRDKTKVDPSGSTYFNLAKAYLKNNQTERCRAALTEYRKLKPKEAKGYILMGDSYFQDRKYAEAIEQYEQAEKLQTTPRIAAQLSIKEGQTYLRLPNHLLDAIQKLEAGQKSDPDNVEIAIGLGGAYLDNKQDDKALDATDRVINSKRAMNDDQRKDLLLVAGKANYNLGKVKESRTHFEQAYKLRPKDVEAKHGLITSIEAQASDAFKKQDYKAANGYLDEAAAIDATTPAINLDRGVILIVQGDCDGAQKWIGKLEGVQGYTLEYERLIARTYMCMKKPDPKKALDHYEKADAEVKKVQANLIQAEIDTEMAPLMVKAGDYDGAVSRLRDAVQFASQAPWILGAAKRNLAVALYRQGWKLLKAGKSTEAAADFEQATREPKLLEGTEESAFNFSYALALLDAGREGDAQKIFSELANKGNQGQYLKPPYDKIGAKFFAAYASYRGGTPAQRADAAKQFSALRSSATGGFGDKIDELLTSSYEFVAYDAWKNGRGGAQKALDSAAKKAPAAMKARIENDKLVLKGSKDPAEFEALESQVPEAYVNAGVAYDAKGKPKEAYDAWTKALAKGATAKDLKKWIDSKKRIYGYQ